MTREASREQYAPGTEFAIGQLTLIGNTGTYLDAPHHRYPDGADLSAIPLTRTVDLPAVVGLRHRVPLPYPCRRRLARRPRHRARRDRRAQHRRHRRRRTARAHAAARRRHSHRRAPDRPGPVAPDRRPVHRRAASYSRTRHHPRTCLRATTRIATPAARPTEANVRPPPAPSRRSFPQSPRGSAFPAVPGHVTSAYAGQATAPGQQDFEWITGDAGSAVMSRCRCPRPRRRW